MLNKIILALSFAICVSMVSNAQHFGIELNLTPGFGFKTFTNDSLVFKKRQGDTRLTFSMQSSLLGKFVFKNMHLGLMAGVGWRFDRLTVNRKAVKDICLFCNQPEDTISLKKMYIESSSYTFPFGIEYAFNAKPKRRHHLAARLLMVPGKLYEVNAYANVDSAKQVNYPMDLQKLETQYERPINKFSLTIMPQLFFCLRLWNPQSTMNLSIAPVAIDLIHVNKTFIKPGMSAMIMVGFQYEFSKKL